MIDGMQRQDFLHCTCHAMVALMISSSCAAARHLDSGVQCTRNCAGALTTAAALPAAAAERDTVSSDADMGPSGSNGSTDQEPALGAEPPSESAEAQAQEAATEADEQAQQPAADAHAAASATAAVGSNGAAAPAEADAAVAGISTASTKPQRRQKDRAGAPRGQQRLQRREPQDRQPTGPVEPIPKVRPSNCVSRCSVLTRTILRSQLLPALGGCEPPCTKEVLLISDKRLCCTQEELWIRAGDVVACKVERSNNRGARVSTLRDPRIIG